MIELTVYNGSGQEVDKVSVDETVLGGAVRYALLKQALVMYHANRRVGTATTKNRSMVAGSTRKLYRQKGTGFARMGASRTNVRRGGGVSFGKLPRDFGKRMPKKQRRLARDSAILGKLLSDSVVVVDELDFEKPATKEFAQVLGNLKIDRSCLVTVEDRDDNLYKSARNVPGVDVMPVSELNAADVCNHHKVLFTRDALGRLVDRSGE